AADNYKAATLLTEIANAGARRGNSPALQKRAQTASKEVAEVVKESHAARLSANYLKDEPNDPDANLQMGRFLALLKGNWQTGLPLLKKGSDAKLSALAGKDLANPADAVGQVAVGDGWWNFAEGQGIPAKNQLLLRARHWYEQAAAQLTG